MSTPWKGDEKVVKTTYNCYCKSKIHKKGTWWLLDEGINFSEFNQIDKFHGWNAESTQGYFLQFHQSRFYHHSLKVALNPRLKDCCVQVVVTM